MYSEYTTRFTRYTNGIATANGIATKAIKFRERNCDTNGIATKARKVLLLLQKSSHVIVAW